jgi:hypothetical protein
MYLQQYAPQATTRGTALPVPKASGNGRSRCGYIGQDVARQQRQLWEAVATLTTKDKGSVRAQHLFCRQGRLLSGKGLARYLGRSPARFQPLPIRTAREVFPQAAHPVSFVARVMGRVVPDSHFHS